MLHLNYRRSRSLRCILIEVECINRFLNREIRFQSMVELKQLFFELKCYFHRYFTWTIVVAVTKISYSKQLLKINLRSLQ